MRASHLFLPFPGKSPVMHRHNATRLLVDGGYIRRMGEGLYAFLPLGMMVLRNITGLLNQEVRSLGGQEVLVPILNPLEFWQATDRDRITGDELFTLRDHKDRGLVMTPAHEESMLGLTGDLVRHEWQLPSFFHQFQTKARDIDGTRDGIINSREFLMFDGYSIQRTFTDLNNFVPRINRAIARVFAACGLKPLVSSGVAFHTGGERSYDFVVYHRQGNYRVVTCPKCGSVADQQVATGLSRINYSRPLPLESFLRDDVAGIHDLMTALGLPRSRFVVARVYAGLEGPVMVLCRGDQEISISKASRLAGDTLVAELPPGEVASLGLVPGFFSPFGLGDDRTRMKVIADSAVTETPNLIMGADRMGRFWMNVNFGRDLEVPLAGDISLVDDGSPCYHCGGPLKIRKGLRIASVYRLNDHYTRRLGLSVDREDGSRMHPFMSSCSLNLNRMLAAIASEHQDRRGLCWPLELAPCKAALMVVGKSASLHRMAEELHRHFSEHLLWDDRPLPFLRKCLDADRMGIPVRVIVSASSLRDGKVRILSRIDGTTLSIPADDVRRHLAEARRKERDSHMAGMDPW